MSDMQESLGLGEERPATGEDGSIARVLEISLALLDTTARPVRRGQHPKHHGCVRAEFIVQPDLPEELRHGVLPRGPDLPRADPLLQRTQLGRPQGGHPRDGDQARGRRGREVAGGREGGADPGLRDWPTTRSSSSATSPITSRSRRPCSRPGDRGGLRLGFMLRVLVSPHPPWKGLRAAMAKKPDSPLRIQYWSQTPYRLGRWRSGTPAGRT